MPSAISYSLSDDGKLGTLREPLSFWTPVRGYEVILPDNPCVLNSDGMLLLGPGFTWDFGSGPAIDTPAMVRASAAHDALCVMTDKGYLPWDARELSDRYFRDQLKAGGVGFARRWWCWAGVRAYSKTAAYWQRQK